MLKAGEIVERGTHEELLSLEGLYSEMWNRQREATEAEDRLRAAHEGDEMGILSRKQPADN